MTLLLERPSPAPLSEYDLDRERARRYLRDFVRQAWHVVEPATAFIPNWHLDCIAAHLEAVNRRELRNLIVNIPPRHMKSLAIAVFWPAWTWATDPACRWLFNSYADDLTVRDSLKCRRVIQSPWYQERWGHVFHLTSDQNVKSRYENDKTGYRISSSVGGGNTGEGGDIIVADDPHNVKEGESEAMRQAVLTWWDETMSTRGDDPKRFCRVIVMQRVHEQDLTGHLLAEQRGYHHLCLPAEYEPRVQVTVDKPRAALIQPHDDCPIAIDPRTASDELLWPDRMGRGELDTLKVDLGAYGAAGQLQQRPVPRAGAIFKVSYFRGLPGDFDEPREDGKTMRTRLRLVTFFDLAWSEKESADYTAALTLGLDASGNAYVLHVWRERVDEQRLDDAIVRQIVVNRPKLVGLEEAAYKQHATRDLVARVLKKLVGQGVACSVVPVPVDKDKVTRARLAEGRGQAGLLYADLTAPWWSAFEQEALAFPRGAHDDQVDALSGALQLAIEKLGHTLPKPEPYTLGDRTPAPSWIEQAMHAQPVRVLRRT